MAELGQAYISVIPSMKGGVGNLTSELTGATTAASGKSGVGFAKGFGKSALKAIGAIGITTSIGGIFAKGWQRMTSIDTAMAKLKTLGYDAQAIKDNALTAVDMTAFGLDTAMTTAASAAAAGIEAGDDMTKYLTSVADAAAMAGIGMDEMGSIFNKVAANGKVSTEEMNQLADRGIPIWQMLADQTGMSMDELRKAVSNGEISLEDFRGAIEENLGGAAKDIGSSTISGAISNIGASLSRMAANFLGSTDKAGTFANKLLPLFKSLQEFMKKVEVGASVLGQVIGAVLGPIMDGLGTVFNELGRGSGTLGPLKDLLLKIGQTLGTMISSVMPVLTPTLRLVFNLIGPIISAISGVLKVLTAGYPVIKGFMKVVGAVAKGIIQTVNTAVRFVTGKLSFAGLVARVKTIWNNVKSAITAPITTARNKVKQIINKIKGFFPLKVGKILSGIKVPKINISGGKAPFGIGGFGTAPKISVSWAAKGGIVDGATLIGAGEAGPEAIVPLDPFWQKLDERTAIDYDLLGAAVANAIAKAGLETVVQLDSKTLARGTAKAMQTEIDKLSTRSNRKLGYV